MSQSDVARAMGVTRNAASKWESGRTTPASDKLLKLASVLRVSPEWLLTGDASALNDTVVPAGEPQIIWCKGIVEAGVWREAMELPRDDWTVSYAPNNLKYDDEEIIALRVAGASMNLVYPDGSEVYVVPIDKFNGTVSSGKRVIVERRRGDLVEATVKELFVDTDGRHWLQPRSSDSRFAEPIDPQPSLDDGNIDSVRITHVVIGSYRPE